MGIKPWKTPQTSSHKCYFLCTTSPITLHYVLRILEIHYKGNLRSASSFTLKLIFLQWTEFMAQSGHHGGNSHCKDSLESIKETVDRYTFALTGKKKKKLKLHVPDRLISFLKPFYLIHQTVFKKIISSGCNSQWLWNVFGWCLFIMAITVNAQLSTRYRAYLSYRPNDLSNSASACVHSTIKPYFPPVIGGTY